MIHDQRMTESQSESASQDFTDQFWNFVENNMGCAVPKYLQLILRVRCYDNAASIGTLTSSDIKQLQEFFREKLKKDAGQNSNLNQNANHKNFFHEFHNDSDEFEILPGHVKLLEKIVSYVNSMTESHGPGYFNTRCEKNIKKSGSKVAVVPRKHIRGPQTISQSLAQSKFVETKAETLLETRNAGEPLDMVTPTDDLAAYEEVAENISSDGSLEAFITDERIRLISTIRVWMQKNVLNFFERYSDQLAPEILEAVMEKSKCVIENGAGNEAMGGDDQNDDNAVSDDLMVLVFKFICPACKKPIRSTQQSTKNGESSYFSLSNIERHWKTHAQENQPKKPKKAKDKENILCKPETRKLRPKACDPKQQVFCDEAELELSNEDESDNEGPGDLKIVPKRKLPTVRQN